MTPWPQTRYSLLARLAEADAAAWQHFERVYQPAIYRYARSRGLQEADALETVQEVMLAVHRGVGAWRPSDRAGSFRAWLAETARRMVLQVMRQRDRVGRGVGGLSETHLVHSGGDASMVETLDQDDEQRWRFFCAAARVEQEVNPATWRAFWLTAVEGRPAEAASRELGLTVGNVYTAKCRVLARIRRCVEEAAAAENRREGQP